LAFGVEIDKDVVRRILSVHYSPESDSGGPSWLMFLGHMNSGSDGKPTSERRRRRRGRDSESCLCNRTYIYIKDVCGLARMPNRLDGLDRANLDRFGRKRRRR
jgi:hypothetical protein